MKISEMTSPQVMDRLREAAAATEAIFTQMRQSLLDDSNTQFVVLVSNGGGICAYDNCGHILKHDRTEIGNCSGNMKQVVKMWHDELLS